MQVIYFVCVCILYVLLLSNMTRIVTYLLQFSGTSVVGTVKTVVMGGLSAQTAAHLPKHGELLQ